METATINYRVADFLKKYPPFHAMDEGDLLELAGSGRVKFFEANEFIVVQGSPFMFQLFVIQQGTVTLWNEEGEVAELLDVRGAGDFLGIEQFNGVDAYPYAARAASDVVVYSFPAMDFESLVMKYAYAQQYVAAYGSVSADYKPADEQRDPRDVFIHELAVGKPLLRCDERSSIRDVARLMLDRGAEAVAVVDGEGRPRAVLTANTLLEWIGRGGGNANEPIAALVTSAPSTIVSDASAADAAIALGATKAGALAMTEDGTANSRVHAVISPRDLAPVFGDHPVAILEEIRRASTIRSLADLNQRARAFVLRRLTSAAAVEWLARFTSLVDAGIVRRLIAISGADATPGCWLFSGAAGRGENLTRLAPELALITHDSHDPAAAQAAFHRVSEGLTGCGYIGATPTFEPSFYAASVSIWKNRYQNWISDPVLQNTYAARRLFDLRPIHGRRELWEEVDSAVRAGIQRDFLYLLANDCLESLPPLTFYEDAVIAESGEESAVFRLEYSALTPLVDVGRVFGLASKASMSSSTLERFVLARTLLPERASIFREASDALRVVLWQQGRVGISRNTNGAELPPALLGRYDRQILKSGFRSIHRLLEFTGNPQWLERL
jgi:CBS domain-containing protein